jgi:hypothetical protein
VQHAHQSWLLTGRSSSKQRFQRWTVARRVSVPPELGRIDEAGRQDCCAPPATCEKKQELVNSSNYLYTVIICRESIWDTAFLPDMASAEKYADYWGAQWSICNIARILSEAEISGKNIAFTTPRLGRYRYFVITMIDNAQDIFGAYELDEAHEQYEHAQNAGYKPIIAIVLVGPDRGDSDQG